MCHRYGSSFSVCLDINKEPISLTSMSILTCMLLQELSGLGVSSGPLFVPDERGVLTRAEQLVFNDAPWLGPQQQAAHLVHPKISFEVRPRWRQQRWGGVLWNDVGVYLHLGWVGGWVSEEAG